MLDAGNISNARDSVSSGYPNTEKRVENTTRSGVFLTKKAVKAVNKTYATKLVLQAETLIHTLKITVKLFSHR